MSLKNGKMMRVLIMVAGLNRKRRRNEYHYTRFCGYSQRVILVV